jgi:arylsulfatase A
LHVAGAEAPCGLQLDGVDQLPLLQGERGRVPTTRFWQWNRYTPALECNAAMRDGDWKLVRPSIAECMQLARADFAMDVDAKLRPERYTDIERRPEPVREAFRVPPAELFNLAHDPFEREDHAAAEPERAARMQRSLEAWFEEVELERRAIRDSPDSERFS